MMVPAACTERIAALLGPLGYLDQPEDLALYEYDGGVEKHRPDLVVFPRYHRRCRRHREDRARIPGSVRGPRRRHRPFRRRHPARGRHRGGLRAHEPHSRNRSRERARRGGAGRGQPGYHAGGREPRLFLRARSLQPAACTIGGNVAENAGGPHTLAYGVTTNHVLGLELVLPDGTVVETGGKEPDLPGYDLTGLLTGSEGTMALVTKVIVRLMRKAEVGEDRAGHLRIQRGCRPHRGRDHRPRHHAGGRRDARWRDAPHGGRGHPRRLPHGRRGRAADRTGRPARSGGGAGGADPRGLPAVRRARVPRGAHRRGARPAVERPQERLRRGGPRQPHLLRAGWRGAAHQDRAHAALHRRGGPQATA